MARAMAAAGEVRAAEPVVRPLVQLEGPPVVRPLVQFEGSDGKGGRGGGGCEDESGGGGGDPLMTDSCVADR